MEAYDLIIIGAGPAGLTAGIYAKRAGIDPLVLEKGVIGGQAVLTDLIENYPGFSGISGLELMQKFELQTKNLGIKIQRAEVMRIETKGAQKTIKTIETSDKKYSAKAVIVATGTSAKKLGIKGEEEFLGRGISYCATCDAPFFKQKNVLVVGGGDAAIKEALFLTKFAKKVYVAHRRAELRATKILADRLLANKKVDVIWDTIVNEIIGEEKVKKVCLENLAERRKYELAVDGVFVFIGSVPNTGFIKVKKDKEGYIITNDKMETSLTGIFAAGDCRAKVLRQIATAVADGALAAVSAEHYLS